MQQQSGICLYFFGELNTNEIKNIRGTNKQTELIIRSSRSCINYDQELDNFAQSNGILDFYISNLCLLIIKNYEEIIIVEYYANKIYNYIYIHDVGGIHLNMYFYL